MYLEVVLIGLVDPDGVWRGRRKVSRIILL